MNRDLYSTAVILTYDDTTESSLVRNKLVINANKIKDKRTHVVVEGERLDQLAYRYYRDNRLWWVIADANDVGDTLLNPFSDLVPGTLLIIVDLASVNAPRA